ncbi:MAG: DUF2382 domain-containing protein [Pseudomonadota bacterium]|nr:DUF2382 domain-containing protein [Pseudomonadota bacterium]
MERNTTHDPSRHNDAATRAQLARLHELNDFKVADGDPDVRGWPVKTSDGRRAGKVDDLIVDTGAMQVRYLDVELDRKTLNLNEERHVLVPISNARLDDVNDDVLLGSMTVEEISRLQPVRHGEPIPATQARTTPDTPHRETDTREFYGKRGGTGAVQRMTLAEEEMRVAKQKREVGGVDIHKTVETEHVSKRVPVEREDVTIERHAVTGDAARSGDVRISEDEIHIPLSGEEAVVQKRTVPREEVVIRKQTVQGEQTVEADLKKERVDVDRSGATNKGKGSRKH